ncbi:MAG: glycosyl hydrolase 108 family protein [Alphaproteobacteria bacterium]|jgi:lysozyme family protein|nr:glycosyl hydrolase 108 family protein [Alphaproteobacteria bacterium]
MAGKFEIALALVLAFEGGVADDQVDPGGLTKAGISLRYLRSLGPAGDTDGDGDVDRDDVLALTRQRVHEHYRTGFYDRCRCEELPLPVALLAFDAAVNQGPVTAIKILQRAAGVQDDGIIGPVTMAAISAQAPVDLAVELAARRARRYARTRNFERYGLGWMRRLSAVLAAAVAEELGA